MKRNVRIYTPYLDMLNLFKLYLENKGYHVRGGVEQYTCHMFMNNEASCPSESPCASIVIIDTHSPEFDVVKRLLSQRVRGCKIPSRAKILICSSITQEEEQFIDQFGINLLKKPFKLALLGQMVSGYEAQTGQADTLPPHPVSDWLGDQVVDR